VIISRPPSAASRPDPDVAIIGAGHNGLTCAAYLAAAGLSVTLYERRGIAGGAAVTEEFHPGFRNSTASYTVSLLHPRIQKDLRLAEHGLTILERPLQNWLVEAPGRGFALGPTSADTARSLEARGTGDAARLGAYHAHVGQAVELLRTLLLKTPPTDLRRWRDVGAALGIGHAFRSLPLTAQRAVHELFTRSAGDLLDGWFDDPALKAAYGFDSIVGSYASPYTPGSAYVLLHHAFGEVNGKAGVWGHARGGMGAITQAMAAEVQRRGSRIELDCAVRRVIVEDGRARGLELEDGRQVRAEHRRLHTYECCRTSVGQCDLRGLQGVRFRDGATSRIPCRAGSLSLRQVLTQRRKDYERTLRRS